jgi:hypothetical protein
MDFSFEISEDFTGNSAGLLAIYCNAYNAYLAFWVNTLRIYGNLV